MDIEYLHILTNKQTIPPKKWREILEWPEAKHTELTDPLFKPRYFRVRITGGSFIDCTIIFDINGPQIVYVYGIHEGDLPHEAILDMIKKHI